ncbi:hypothetical protein DFH06DRAFT_1136146 [Mycena polygramma]|nr:hypothetical protein DFH06DRAFT_1136146 [Mycena polygramma]
MQRKRNPGNSGDEQRTSVRRSALDQTCYPTSTTDGDGDALRHWTRQRVSTSVRSSCALAESASAWSDDSLLRGYYGPAVDESACARTGHNGAPQRHATTEFATKIIRKLRLGLEWYESRRMCVLTEPPGGEGGANMGNVKRLNTEAFAARDKACGIWSITIGGGEVITRVTPVELGAIMAERVREGG